MIIYHKLWLLNVLSVFHISRKASLKLKHKKWKNGEITKNYIAHKFLELN